MKRSAALDLRRPDATISDAIRSCRQSRARTEARYDEALRSSWPDETQRVLMEQRRCLHREADELVKLQF